MRRHDNGLHPVARVSETADISPVTPPDPGSGAAFGVAVAGDESQIDGFGARLALALKASNMSRSQLSAAMGVDKSVVSRWLSGQTAPASHNLARISALLAKQKPGFNMTLWTAPMAEFEAALGLQPAIAAPAIELRSSAAADSQRRPGLRMRYGALASVVVLALIAVGFLLWHPQNERVASVSAPASKRHTANNAQAIRLTQAARALIHERNRLSVAEAEHLLREAVAADPSYAPAWARLGYATWFPWWWAEQHEAGAKLRLKAEALAYIRRALAIVPNSAEAQGIMGMVLTDTNEGVPWLESAVRLDADDPELWFWLAEARLANNDLKGALTAMEKAHSIDPAWHRSDEAYLHLLFRIRSPAEAYAELDRMAKTMNDQTWPLQTRADLQYAEGKLADSAALAAAALRTRPQNPFWARSLLVFIAALLGDKALQDRMLVQDSMLRANFNASHKPGWAYDRAQSSPDTWWDATLVGEQASQLVSEGRSALLVSLYDRRFKTPEDFISKCPAFCSAISVAPALALALRKAGRSAEANAVLAGAAKEVAKLQSSGDRQFNTEVSSARLAALSGDGATAKRYLRDAVQRGWKGQDTGFPDPAADQAFASLRTDPEFQAIAKSLRASQHAEAEKLARLDMSGI